MGYENWWKNTREKKAVSSKKLKLVKKIDEPRSQNNVVEQAIAPLSICKMIEYFWVICINDIDTREKISW